MKQKLQIILIIQPYYAKPKKGTTIFTYNHKFDT
jgi:hypothetical protein